MVNKKELVNWSICDICKKDKGTVWHRSFEKRGTPLFNCVSLNICKKCNKNKKEEIKKICKNELKKRKKLITKQLKEKIWSSQEMQSENIFNFISYWFKNDCLSLKEYENKLGFKFPETFKNFILNLKCENCKTPISKITTQEQFEAKFKHIDLPEIKEDEYDPCKLNEWREATRVLHVATNNYCIYDDLKRYYYICSRNCFDKMFEKNKNIKYLLY